MHWRGDHKDLHPPATLTLRTDTNESTLVDRLSERRGLPLTTQPRPHCSRYSQVVAVNPKCQKPENSKVHTPGSPSRESISPESAVPARRIPDARSSATARRQGVPPCVRPSVRQSPPGAHRRPLPPCGAPRQRLTPSRARGSPGLWRCCSPLSRGCTRSPAASPLLASFAAPKQTQSPDRRSTRAPAEPPGRARKLDPQPGRRRCL